MPESEVGEMAQVASACVRASCSALCRLYNRESGDGRDCVNFVVTWFFVGGGVKGLLNCF